MALPADIYNGDIPDATKLMAWFTWFMAGRGIKKDTLANLKAAAQADPNYPFLAVETETKQVYMYMGDATIGDEGFIVLGGG